MAKMFMVELHENDLNNGTVKSKIYAVKESVMREVRRVILEAAEGGLAWDWVDQEESLNDDFGESAGSDHSFRQAQG